MPTSATKFQQSWPTADTSTHVTPSECVTNVMSHYAEYTSSFLTLTILRWS